ncbi:acyl-CoA thioesterase [Bacteriovoracaceae bacterium]|nr:acyl-CoA thioesterase [Bacteriovoracaceae bacterium]
MKELDSKKVSESQVIMREMVMPGQTNPQNTIFGGVVMSWIDVAAAMCAAKHSHKAVVTAHIDNIDFINPIKVGEHVIISASVNYVGNTSMIVGVKVESENPITREFKKTTKAYLTFVALDSNSRPTKVPGLIPESDDEKRRYKNAQERKESRKRLSQKLK